jgi:O-antigen ligase
MSHRAAAGVLSLGTVAVAVAGVTYKVFELDRYFVPKELVLHVVALVLGMLVLARARTTKVDAADTLLAAFLLWSAASAMLATNYWLSQRALSLSVASAIVFWSARRLGDEGAHRAILAGAATATVCAAAIALVQAYGAESEFFSLNRAPGGTFGNRNFVAHFCAIGLPALVYVTVSARSPLVAFMGTLSCGAVVALLVLTRSRAAWLALVASTVVLLPLLWVSRKYWGTRLIGGRVARIALIAAVASAAVIALPNRLDWRSDSPYLDSAARLADYTSGSGRGRLAQYMNSARMAAHDPLFGVGPGNWPVRYVGFAPSSDPSLADDGMTANPWPSSDWVAFVSERGAVAAIALAGVFLFLFVKAMRRWDELLDGDAVLAKLATVGTIVATLVVSTFDAVLLLAAPALLAWSIIGAGSGVGRGGRLISFSRPQWLSLMAALLLAQTVAVARSATQVAAISLVGTGGGRASWSAAAAWDPGSYRINARVAEQQAAAGRCGVARAHARRALGLFPESSAPKRVLRDCR